jgi:predicted GNAT family N-acyltransferase
MPPNKQKKMISVKKIDNPADLKEAFKIREEVFVIEQKVPKEEEYDEHEHISHHFLALDEDGKPVGTSRWRKTEKGVKLERFAVMKGARSLGVGSALVKSVLDDISLETNEPTKLYLHAQIDAMPLYAKFGFVKKGEPFDECGIMHYVMEK